MNFKEIYEKSFSVINYNLHSDTEPRFEYVNKFISSNDIKSIIDIGSGRGNLLNIIKSNYPNIKLYSSDLKKFNDIDVPFYEINLCDKETFNQISNEKFDLLSCLDVMEHISKECVDDVLKIFSDCSKNCLLTIANHSDVLNGIELHVIQEDMSYWGPLIEKYFTIIDLKKEYGGRLYLLTLKSKNYEE